MAMAAALMLTAPSVAAETSGTYAEAQGCSHSHPSRVAYRMERRLLRHHRPTVRKGRVRHYATCVATRAKARAVRAYVRRSWKWRHSYRHVWPIRLARMPASWVQWARNITACESGWNRYARDYATGTHVSYFQWALSTWFAAGGTGHPFDASWPHQAVLAIRWAQTAGTSQWVCRG